MSSLGNFKSFFTPQMDAGRGTELGNQIWNGVANMGVALSKLSQEQEKIAADKEYRQQKMALDRESMAQQKAMQDKQYLLEYQKTANAAKSNQFDLYKDMAKLKIDMNKEERAQFDFNDKVKKQDYLNRNAQKYADAWATGDLSKLSAKDQAMMDSQDRINLYKHIGSKSEDVKKNTQVSQFYDRYGEDLFKIENNLKVDPNTGKSNAQNLFKGLHQKLTQDINDGRVDSKIAFDEYRKHVGIVKKQLELMGGSSSSSAIPSEFTRYNIDEDGNLTNPSNYMMNTLEGEQELLNDIANINSNPNAKFIVARTSRNKAGISGISVVKPSKAKKKSSDAGWDEFTK